MAQEQVKEYLEAIYDIAGKNSTAKTTAIAKCLKVTPASVTEALQSLAEKNLVNYEPYQGATLTESGRMIAEKIKRRHRLLEVFLTDVLRINREKVHDQACRMEHTLSEETECALCKMLDAPSRCPHGSPIGPCDKGITNCADCRTGAETENAPTSREGKLIPITALAPGSRGRLRLSVGTARSSGTFRYRLKTGDNGIGPVQSHIGRAGSVFVRRTKHVIDHAVADDILSSHLLEGIHEHNRSAITGTCLRHRSENTPDTIKPPARVQDRGRSHTGPFRQRLLAMGIIPGTRDRK